MNDQFIIATKDTDKKMRKDLFFDTGKIMECNTRRPGNIELYLKHVEDFLEIQRILKTCIDRNVKNEMYI